MSITWEAAVQWLRDQPEKRELVEQCYFDDPLLEAAQRFASSPEWSAVKVLLPSRPGRALDIGAGRGIASFALARAGWKVVALEPDPSDLVGAGAIRTLALDAELEISVIEEFGEKLPFPEASFDLVLARQVLHHASNLPQFCSEMARVLRPGGRLVATREHVISGPDQLAPFLALHPLQSLYGGENAFTLNQYLSSFGAAGLRITSVLGPYDSVINYYPMSDDARRRRCIEPLRRWLGMRLAVALTSSRHPLGRWLLPQLARTASHQCTDPGRLYSFVAEKS